MDSCLRMVRTLCIGYCKLRVGLCKAPLQADFSNLCSFCLLFPLGLNPLSSFLQPGSSCSSFRSAQSSSGAPSTQLSLCHSTCCMVIEWCLSSPHWRCVLLVFCPQCLHHKCLNSPELDVKRTGVFSLAGVGSSVDWAARDWFTFESCRNLISKLGHCSPYWKAALRIEWGRRGRAFAAGAWQTGGTWDISAPPSSICGVRTGWISHVRNTPPWGGADKPHLEGWLFLGSS